MHQTHKSVAGPRAPAGGSVEPAPGGYHMMPMGLKTPLKSLCPLTLHFERAGSIDVELKIKPEDAL